MEQGVPKNVWDAAKVQTDSAPNANQQQAFFQRDISLLTPILKESFEKFTDSLRAPNASSFADFIRIISGSQQFSEQQLGRNWAFDFILQNSCEFLYALQHPNWHWHHLFPSTKIRDFFLTELIPKLNEPKSLTYLARIVLKLFCLALRDESGKLVDEFHSVFGAVCKLKDFPAICSWLILDIIASEEIIPFLAGGTCTVTTFIPVEQFSDKSIYEENLRVLSIPSLLQSRPESRSIRSKPRIGSIHARPAKKKISVITVSPDHAARNLSLVMHVLIHCCEALPGRQLDQAVESPPRIEAAKPSRVVDNQPASPDADITDISPASPPGDATGLLSDSPASPEAGEFHSFKPPAEETHSNRYRVEFKESAMKVLLPIGEEPKKNGDASSAMKLRRSLHTLSGWHWLSVCLIDVLKPEEQDRSISWPEFHSVAHFNRNVHIVKEFQRNPLWMRLLDMASRTDAFVYFSPLLRPVYISLFIHWETALDSCNSPRNTFFKEQTLWLIRCLSQGRMLHGPYSFLGSIIEHLLPHELSSILASLWKVVKAYFPNPHGLLTIPETEQDYRAKQMAETDCLLKIRAICLMRLPQMKDLAKRFFLPARVPLEEARWFESTQSQEAVSSAPIDASHLTREI